MNGILVKEYVCKEKEEQNCYIVCDVCVEQHRGIGMCIIQTIHAQSILLVLYCICSCTCNDITSPLVSIPLTMLGNANIAGDFKQTQSTLQTQRGQHSPYIFPNVIICHTSMKRAPEELMELVFLLKPTSSVCGDRHDDDCVGFRPVMSVPSLQPLLMLGFTSFRL